MTLAATAAGENCLSCGLCVAVCPAAAEIPYSYAGPGIAPLCRRCFACWEVCPAGARSWLMEEFNNLDG